ncbi:hypothetical protein E3N88_29317 [Mikania micrantha]|uniref:CCR4-NOT transcription complex subunit 1 CAF1-binding domain-containing protein n=1 Tax=Mikania micrantha TaxID=192012 RepID=A0A5N6MLD1_9ASTR|nr:hypothetical protein E3N88_29317 [Mikania micrantha]
MMMVAGLSDGRDTTPPPPQDDGCDSSLTSFVKEELANIEGSECGNGHGVCNMMGSMGHHNENEGIQKSLKLKTQNTLALALSHSLRRQPSTGIQWHKLWRHPFGLQIRSEHSVESARIAGASRIIVADLNANRFSLMWSHSMLVQDYEVDHNEECSLMKNLGGWPGKLTIGRNHVLRANLIDPKALVIEIFMQNIHILESDSNSLEYQAPNPWTMGVLPLLAEIYAIPNLKMNLKFEIEANFGCFERPFDDEYRLLTETSVLEMMEFELKCYSWQGVDLKYFKVMFKSQI